MSLLERLREARPPRSDELAWRVARAIHSRIAMALLGLLYFLTLPNVVLLAIFLGLLAVAPYAAPVPGWYGAVAFAVALGGAAVAFIPFHRWRQRRRALHLELGRSGKLVETRMSVIKLTYREYQASVHVEGIPARTLFPPRGVRNGDQIHVLHAPHCKWMLGFKPNGKPFVLRVQQAR